MSLTPEEAWAAVLKYQDAARASARKRARTKQEREDLTQDALLWMYHAALRFDGRGALGAWLCIQAKHCVQIKLTHESRSRKYTQEDKRAATWAPTADDAEVKAEVATQMRRLQNLVPARHVQILEDVLLGDVPVAYLATKYGVVRQRIDQIYRTCIKRRFRIQ